MSLFGDKLLNDLGDHAEILSDMPMLLCRYFLNASNHADGQAPSVASYHQAMTADGDTAASFFTQWDSIHNGYVMAVTSYLFSISYRQHQHL